MYIGKSTEEHSTDTLYARGVLLCITGGALLFGIGTNLYLYSLFIDHLAFVSTYWYKALIGIPSLLCLLSGIICLRVHAVRQASQKHQHTKHANILGHLTPIEQGLFQVSLVLAAIGVLTLLGMHMLMLCTQ